MGKWVFVGRFSVSLLILNSSSSCQQCLGALWTGNYRMLHSAKLSLVVIKTSTISTCKVLLVWRWEQFIVFSIGKWLNWLKVGHLATAEPQHLTASSRWRHALTKQSTHRAGSRGSSVTSSLQDSACQYISVVRWLASRRFCYKTMCRGHAAAARPPGWCYQ